MSRAAEVAQQIERTVTGPMWHGPALARTLEGLTPEQAAARPIAGAHSVWEIVLHIAVWAEVAGARLQGQHTGDPAPDEDWPPVGATGAAAWRLALERLVAVHRELAASVRALSDEALDARVRGLDYSVSILLHGVVEHGTYHGGQIALLRRALTA